MATNYRQTDPRWANYPYAGENMAAAGCGPTSVADLLDKSPVEIANWMTSHGYASNGSGTYQSGITSCIRAYGHSCSQLTGSSRAGIMNDPGFETFKSSIQQGNCGILLMGGQLTGCRNSYWSKAGHFIAIVGYKDGKYLVYDPAWYARDGYHDWYDFQGNIKHVFVTDIKWKFESTSTTSSTDYKFTVSQISLGSTGRDVRLWQRLLCGRGFNTAIDGEFGDDCQAKTIDFQKALKIKADGIVGIDTWRAMIPCYSDANGTNLTFTLHEISYGYQGAEAYFLQNLFRGYGYTIKLDFEYGDGCANAVRDWKSKNGLNPKDLACGKNTFSRLIGK
jgi:hypothetical protein